MNAMLYGKDAGENTRQLELISGSNLFMLKVNALLCIYGLNFDVFFT